MTSLETGDASNDGACTVSVDVRAHSVVTLTLFSFESYWNIPNLLQMAKGKTQNGNI